MSRQDCVLGGSSFLLVSGPRTKPNQSVYLTDVRNKNGLYLGQLKEEPTQLVATERGEALIHLLFINSMPCLPVRAPLSQHFLVKAHVQVPSPMFSALWSSSLRARHVTSKSRCMMAADRPPAFLNVRPDNMHSWKRRGRSSLQKAAPVHLHKLQVFILIHKAFRIRSRRWASSPYHQ